MKKEGSYGKYSKLNGHSPWRRGEIGKNMTVFEYDRDIIVVDCGSMFPKDDMLGIDLVIPDASYLVANKERVRGYVFTHGHEDHIGAVPYVVSQVPAAPVRFAPDAGAELKTNCANTMSAACRSIRWRRGR